jgi:prolyl 4-hydroxylase
MKDALKSAPKPTVLSKSPRVAYWLDLVSPGLTRRVIALARPKLKRALVMGANRKVASDGRIARSVSLENDGHPAIRAVVDAMSLAAGLDRRHAEPLQVAHYGVGGEYRPHFDSYNPKTDVGRRHLAARGQRLLTALLYLNDDFTDGTTEFPRLGFAVVARRGAVLTFENCRRGGTRPHPKSVHAGLPVSQGEKWIGVLWFRER